VLSFLLLVGAGVRAKEQGEIASVDVNATANWDACGTKGDCNDCYTLMGCHWCEHNQQCHAYFSPSGCNYGASCDRDNKSNATCASRNTCEDCYSSYICQWCSAETGCYAKPLGCTIGATCESNSCKSQTNCTSCYNTRGCHWCEDGCHAIGSAYGCAYGVTCYSNGECLRKASAFQGYGPCETTTLVAVCVFVVTSLVMVLCGVRYRCNARRALRPSHCREEEEVTQTAEASPDMAESERRSAALANPEEPSQTSMIALNVELTRQTSAVLDLVRRGSRCITLCMVCGCCLSVPAAICLAVAGVLYSPRDIEISYCNTKLDWLSVIRSLQLVRATANFELLMTMYNPNRLDAHVTDIQGSFYDSIDNTKVASLTIKPFELTGGSLTDRLAVIEFVVSEWKALALGVEYSKGTLVLLADVNVTFEVWGWRRQLLWPLHYKLEDYAIAVNDPADRHLCNCMSERTSTNRPPWTILDV